MILQVIAILFILFAASRVVLRYKDKQLTTIEFLIWILLWLGISIVIILPRFSTLIANFLGVGRGVDAIIYISIIVLFYGLFRVYIKLEFIEHEITQLVRKKALLDIKRKDEDSNNK